MPFSFFINLSAPIPHSPPPPAQCLRAFIYNLVREADQTLSESIHRLDLKPFTISPLRKPKQVSVTSEPLKRWLRVTTLTIDVGVSLLRSLRQLQESEATVRLGDSTYALDQISVAVRPQHESSYESLRAEAPIFGVDLLFTSPTAFKDHDRNVPLPLPGPLINSLWAKWHAFCGPATLPDDSLEGLIRAVVISRHEIRTHRLTLSDRHEVGFVGRLRLQLHSDDTQLGQVFAALVYFSEFCGIGARCTLGMGQVKILGATPMQGGNGQFEKH